MIEFIHIENFKSLKKLTIRPSGLNLFFGMNGMGKSSLLQALLLLRQSNMKGTLSEKGLLLNDLDLISLGSGKDVFHYTAGKDECLVIELHLKGRQELYWSFSYDAMADILPKKSYILQPASAEKENSLFKSSFRYLSAEHIGPQKQYPKSDSGVRQYRNLGVKGEYTAHYLSEYGNSSLIEFENLKHPAALSSTLLHQTNAWLGEISPGTKLIVEDIKAIDSVRMGLQFETMSGFTNEFTTVNVGFGILYVLPVIVALLSAESGSIVFLENPESHLHPKGQSAMGRLMSLAAQNGVQIFCESHSDHIINGSRVAVKQHQLDRQKLAIYYFDRDIHDDDHKSRVTSLEVDPNGELNEYPQGLLDEWSNLLTQLL